MASPQRHSLNKRPKTTRVNNPLHNVGLRCKLFFMEERSLSFGEGWGEACLPKNIIKNLRNSKVAYIFATARLLKWIKLYETRHISGYSRPDTPGYFDINCRAGLNTKCNGR